MRMEKTKAVIDADFYIKLTEYAPDKGKLLGDGGFECTTCYA